MKWFYKMLELKINEYKWKYIFEIIKKYKKVNFPSIAIPIYIYM